MLLLPFFIFTRAHLIFLFTPFWGLEILHTQELRTTSLGENLAPNCHLLFQVSHQYDQSKSFVLVRKGRFMRLGQFSCCNHDVGSSPMMASLCIHRKNRNKIVLMVPKTENFSTSTKISSCCISRGHIQLCLIYCSFFRKPCWWKNLVAHSIRQL